MLQNVITEIFGTYTPQTYTTVISGEAITVIPSGVSGVDFVWVGGVVLFALTFYCIMRIVGGVLK